jgi:MshEN domain
MSRPAALAEFCEMVRRNLGARSVAVTAQAPEPRSAADTLFCPLPGGGFLAVVFDQPPLDRTATEERLESLVSSFDSLLETLPRPGQPTVDATTALHEQVVSLAERASAVEVVIIDAKSPVVWDSLGGSFVATDAEDPEQDPDNVRRIDHPGGRPKRPPADLVARARVLGVRLTGSLVMDPRLIELVPPALCEQYRLVPLYVRRSRLGMAMSNPADLDAIRNVALACGRDIEPVLCDARLIDLALRWKRRRTVTSTLPAGTPALGDSVRERWERYFGAHKAIALVRRHPEMPNLHKGAHLVFGVNSDAFGCFAKSFAGIYVLILVFAGRYDEIKAKHAVANTLPVIERLVLALPPRDPSPQTGGAMANRIRVPHRR